MRKYNAEIQQKNLDFLQNAVNQMKKIPADIQLQQLPDEENTLLLGDQLQKLVDSLREILAKGEEVDLEDSCQNILNQIDRLYPGERLHTVHDLPSMEWNLAFQIRQVKSTVLWVLASNPTLARAECILHYFMADNYITTSEYDPFVPLYAYLKNEAVSDQHFMKLLLYKEGTSGYSLDDLARATKLGRDALAEWLVRRVEGCSKEEKIAFTFKIMDKSFKQYNRYSPEMAHINNYLVHQDILFLSPYLNYSDFTEEEKRSILLDMVQACPFLLATFCSAPVDAAGYAGVVNPLTELLDSVEQIEQQALVCKILHEDCAAISFLDMYGDTKFDSRGVPKYRQIWDSLEVDDRLAIMKHALHEDVSLFRFIKQDILDTTSYTVDQQLDILNVFLRRAERSEQHTILWDRYDVTEEEQEKIKDCLHRSGEHFLSLLTGLSRIDDAHKFISYLLPDEVANMRTALKELLDERSQNTSQGDPHLTENSVFHEGKEVSTKSVAGEKPSPDTLRERDSDSSPHP